MALPLSPTEFDPDGRVSFRRMSESFARLTAAEGISVQPYEQDSLPWFSALPPAGKRDVLQRLDRYLTACEQTVASGAPLRDTRTLTWKMIKIMGFTLEESLFEEFGAGDIVELFSRRHLQFFANMRFYEMTCYTLEDLYCRPWMELWERESEDVVRDLTSVIESVLTQPEMGTRSISRAPHMVTERCSLERRQALIQPRLFSPLFRGRECVGFLDIVTTF